MHFNLDLGDRVIELFQSNYPNGRDYSDAAFNFLEKGEGGAILKFLLQEGILEKRKSDGEYVLTTFGLEITPKTGGIRGYLDRKLKQTEEDYRMKVIRNQKLKKDAKLAQEKSWINRLFGNRPKRG